MPVSQSLWRMSLPEVIPDDRHQHSVTSVQSAQPSLSPEVWVLFHFPFSCICVCSVHMPGMSVYVGTRVHACVCMERLQVPLLFCLIHRGRVSDSISLALQPAQGIPCLCLLRLALHAYPAQHARGFWGSELRSSCFCSKCFSC